MLKTKLKKIVAGPRPFKITDELLKEMLNNIGNLDSELRDNLIYGVLAEALQEDSLTIIQKKEIWSYISEKNLIVIGITEIESDMIFTRSFAVLILTSLLANDATTHFLSEAELKKSFELALTYLKDEKDTRDYIVEKGWAHGLAHGADLLTFTVSHPSFSFNLSEKVLKSLTKVIFRPTTPFNFGEEDRLSQVIIALVDRHPEALELLIPWLRALENDLFNLAGRETYTLAYSHIHFKYYSFVQSIYFRLLAEDEVKYKETLQKIMAIIKEKFI